MTIAAAEIEEKLRQYWSEEQRIPIEDAELREIVAYNLKHNAEVEACDLLIEMDKLPLVLEYVDEPDHSRVCLYLLRYSFIFFILIIFFKLFTTYSSSR